MPGTGDTIYIFDIDECFGENVPEPLSAADGDTPEGFYDASAIREGLSNGTAGGGKNIFSIDIKPDSGQVTSEKAEEGEGRSLVGTAVVDHSIGDFSKVDEALAFRNIGVLIPDNAGAYYVIMSKYKRTQYTCNYDSGTTYDSDHGFTITFTCNPVLYACPKVKLTQTAITNLIHTD